MTNTVSEGATSTGVGTGIVTLEELRDSASLTKWGELRKQLQAFEATEAARKLDRVLIDIGARFGDGFVRERQRRNEKLLAKFYKSEAREKKEELQRRVGSGTTAFLFSLAFRSARQGLQSLAASREQRARIKHIWDVLAAAARDADGKISKPAQAKIGALLQQAGASPDFCKKLLDQRISPATLISVPRLDEAVFSPEVREAIGHVVVFSVGTKLGEPGLVSRNILRSFLRDTIGLEDNIAHDLARRSHDITEETSEELSALISESIRRVAKISLRTQMVYPGVDLQYVQEVSKRLASYDPDKQRREKLQGVLKTGGLAALAALEPTTLGKVGLGQAAAVTSHSVAKAMLGRLFTSAPEREFLAQLKLTNNAV